MTNRSSMISNKRSVLLQLEQKLSETPPVSVIVTLLTVAFALNVAIILGVPYTEIDFATYMQQVDIFLRGERYYPNIRGDTGPCVYPSGFLYIYAIFHGLSQADSGEDTKIRAAQYAFAMIYVIGLGLVFLVLRRCKAPLHVFLLSMMSRRMLSIHVLRLFNDPLALLFQYAAMLSINHRAIAGALFGMGLSVKMNLLLFLPGWIAVYLSSSPTFLIAVVTAQALIGLPFLMRDSLAYLNQAFDLRRQFLYKWSVNWQFIDESLFISREFSSALLLSTITCWGVMFMRRRKAKSFRERVDCLLLSNMIGITFARSLHYQFYSWYAFFLAYMIWRTKLPVAFRIGLQAVIELAWNMYPPSASASSILFSCHVALVMMLLVGDR